MRWRVVQQADQSRVDREYRCEEKLKGQIDSKQFHIAKRLRGKVMQNFEERERDISIYIYEGDRLLGY